jgi:hypothetical protein
MRRGPVACRPAETKTLCHFCQSVLCVRSWRTIIESSLSCFFSPRSPSTWPQPSDLFCVTNKTPSRCLGLSRLVLRAPPLSTPGAASWGPTWSPEFIVPFSFTTIRFKKKKKLGQIILFNRLLFNSHIISCLIIVHELLIRITVFDIILC